jgi:hypothetical protein
MKNLIKHFSGEVTGLIIGTVAGYGFWFFVGCKRGNCMITSDPFNSALYGAIMGALIFGLVSDNKLSINKNEKNK